MEESEYAHFVWCLARTGGTGSFLNNQAVRQGIPSWSAFNAIKFSDKIPQKSIIGYCPVIDAAPTELSTVYTLLCRSLDMAKQLGQQSALVVLDQAIYAKAIEITWNHTEEFKNIVLRMGAFHISCNFLGVIGKRFGDAGLADVLVESNIVAAGSINGVIDGTHYNRAVRAHKIMYEALFRLQWELFTNWLQEKNFTFIPHDFDVTLEAINKLMEVTSREGIIALNTCDSTKRIYSLFIDFCREDRGKMFRFWHSYMSMVNLLLSFIESSRVANWSLHISCIQQMIKWMFAYDHTNYARYLSIYVHDMYKLPHTHPDIHRALQSGECAVQRGVQPFAQIPVDQTIEQTINRSSKTKGGIIGFSLNKMAVQRWALTAHNRASIVENMKEMIGMNDVTSINQKHKENSEPRKQRDEKDINSVCDLLKANINPFNPSDKVNSLLSGIMASDNVVADLENAYRLGESASEQFAQQRLLSRQKDVFAPLPKLNLKTFSEMMKCSKMKFSKKHIVLKSDRDLFSRMLVIAQNRSLDLQKIFQYSLGPLPWALSTTDGNLSRTEKSKLQSILEENYSSSVASYPLPTESIGWVVDGMAMLHSLSRIPQTFQGLANLVFDSLLKICNNSSRIDFVTDQYPVPSIKDFEHYQRSKDNPVIIRISNGNTKCPLQWTRYISNCSNKSTLIEFLFQQWQGNEYADKLNGRQLFVVHGHQCHRLYEFNDSVTSDLVPELCSSQEEADTRMILHCKHMAESGINKIIIKSVDTDVEVLACHFAQEIPSTLYMQLGTKQRTKLINISEISNNLGPNICSALPGLHAFTGCDTTSCFIGKGKQVPFNLIIGNPEHCRAMCLLGQSCTISLSDVDMQPFECFVCDIYKYPRCSDINRARYELFCSRNRQSVQLPPTRDELRQHLKRANYQAAIWRKSLQPMPSIPSPDGNGWKVQDGKLSIHWMDQSPAPNALLELISCGCKGVCAARCSCFKNNLPCTATCNCTDICTNHSRLLTEHSDSDEDD